jgi:hypothetical protein
LFRCGPSKLHTSLRFFTACSLNLGACNHGYPSTTALVSAELSDGGASASMLITLRSFPVITIRPIEADDPFLAGMRSCLFALGGKLQIPALHISGWNWPRCGSRFFVGKVTFQNVQMIFPPFHNRKHIQFDKVPEPRYWGLTSPGGSPLCTFESLGGWLDE